MNIPSSAALSQLHLPVGARESVPDGLAEESLPRAWLKRWSEQPRHIVAISADGIEMTAEELEEKSAQIAARLAGAGLSAGDRIIISSEPSMDLLVAYVAAHRMSLTVVPLNTSYGPSEIRKIIQNVAPRAALVDDSARGRTISEAATEPIVVVGCDVDLPSAALPSLDLADRHTPALICHTSGTTGTPKGAVLTSGNLLASAESVRVAWRWTPDDRLILALPLFHLHGLGMGLNGTLVAGASVVILKKFSPAAVAESSKQHSGSMFFGVPTMYHRFASSTEIDALRPLRLCVSGSAPLSAELHNQILESSGQMVLERYGMTETVITVSNPYEGERRPGTVGLPLPNVDLRLANGDSGEIQLKGPSVFTGYLNNPGATAATLTPDGWFRTGDLGEMDPDGYLRIVGRSKELIISGGYNVYPREIEELLQEHPDVAEAAVVGCPSAEWGETVVAFVVPTTAGFGNDAELIEYAAARLAPYKRPRRVVFVDALPRNELGKIVRSELISN
ncbi:class I adenylate-forming enzyme family protein [Rhodococcus globerulus]|uniref:AMP-binding protein n=1 Tax=Rhodococcus globerulus TaxID=33008 RepID=A0ABU4C4J3_RHOGO|nr:AMP-binding protein [Rhodococcus globerulus]MDV6271133.1 AMP-binding protein [Rhodococcus globerulus]